MRKLSLVIMLLFAFVLTGCSTPNNSAHDVKFSYTPSAFVTLLEKQYRCNTQIDFAKKNPGIFGAFNDRSFPNAKLSEFVDITPSDVKQQTGCQIFKNRTVPISFALYKDKAYPIAAPIYGLGIINIETCDFDNNGKIDIIYSNAACLSGLAAPTISCFNFTDLKETEIYSSRDTVNFMLKKVNNQTLNVYTIAENKSYLSEDNNYIYDQSKWVADKHVGIIERKNNTPEMRTL